MELKEVKSIEDLPSKDDSRPLHKLLDELEIMKIKEAFEREDGRKMNNKQLRDTLLKAANIEYKNDVQYNIIFRKMNSGCNGFVTWDEFISFLILGFEQEEVSLEYKTLDPPIPMSPTIVKSYHRHNVNRITFYPTVKPDRSSTWNDGSIVTSSNDGTINYWSLDMQVERTTQSTCSYLKVQTTWVTDMVVLPDVSIICTSSTERDLRFYDTSARKFDLRLLIPSFPYAINTMYYRFEQDIRAPSKLLCGDTDGNIRLLYIETEARGPFKSEPGSPLKTVHYDTMVKKGIPFMRLVEFVGIHTDFIRQIYYYRSLHGAVTCAECYKAFQITDVLDPTKVYTFKIIGGVWSFAISEEMHLVATGGPDCLIRIWNPFVAGRPICTFYGHHTGILQLLFQDNGTKLYSLSKDKCIKVWDIGLQDIIQTYLELPSCLGDYTHLTTLYNPQSRQWIIGSVMIAIISLNPKQSSEHTDGTTHRSGVSAILYNTLFQCVVSCGLDSYIIVWDPWDGRRLLVINEAHTVMIHGEILPVEITAATFDPGWQRLLTGAHDGTLKIWNFNTGTCLRNLKVDPWCEIQAVIWVKGRIMATGWNRRVTEFADKRETEGPGEAFCKNWDLRHSEDISSGVVRVPETVATASYAGELVLWRLETGQPYKKFNVAKPKKRIKIFYQLKAKKQIDDVIPKKISRNSLPGSAPRTSELGILQGPSVLTGAARTPRQKRVSSIVMPDEILSLKKLAVHTMLFLNARSSEPEIGTLLVSLESGYVQVWNHLATGEYMTAFLCIHKAGDYVISMATDNNNEYLFVGTTVGYIKTYLLKNYCVPEKDKVHLCMPEYRLKFPFMWGDRFMCRAQRVSKDQPFPILLNSYKGHIMPISGILYIDQSELLISCSADYSCRIWTIGGRYLQTLGTFKPWKPLNSLAPMDPNTTQFDIPPDIKRVASSATLRVLCGGSLPKRLTIKQLAKIQAKEQINVDYTKIYGRPLQHPVLGQHYAIPESTTKPRDIEFDTSFFYVPVFSHLITPAPAPVEQHQRGTWNKKH